MFVACKLPSGHIIDHKGQRISLRGTNTGVNNLALPTNGAIEDGKFRSFGYGITEIDGDQADAMADWIKQTENHEGPVQAGLIFVAKSESDLRGEAQKRSERAGLNGIDPNADLPEEVETAAETPKKK